MATTGPIDLLPQLTRTGSAQAAATPRAGHSRARRILTYVLFGVAILVIWESVKFVGGVPWRFQNVLGTDIDIEHFPPFRWAFASDLNLPHWWNILAALAAPVQRNAESTLGQFLVGAAFYTWREAVIGFIVGALLGLLLATVFVHSRLAERAFVPYVVASQTIPIVALAPMIVFAFGPNVTSVVVIATYLTFFPVTIAMIRGLRAPDPRALELMRSYAAGALGDVLEAPLAGVDAVPVHRAQDRRDRVDRRGDHRGGTGRDPQRLGPGDHQLQPAVHHRPREAVGSDPRRLAARRDVLRDDPRTGARRVARPAGGGRRMTGTSAGPVVRIQGVDKVFTSDTATHDRTQGHRPRRSGAGSSSR